jgi:hypothetical protein
MRLITNVLVSLILSSFSAFAQSGQVLTNPTLNGGVLNGTSASLAVVTAGGSTQSLTSWLTSFVPAGGTAADLGPAAGPILGLWPNLYFAPSPVFTGMPTVSGGSTAQMQFTRNGLLFTFIGAAPGSVGISSSENLPIVLANNGYQPRIYVDPTYGNVGIGTVTPASRLDVAAQSIIIEQAYTPPSSSTFCATGTIAWDSGYVYVCVITNTWKRTALGTF